ncbi:hypothetical protein PAXRUDRAFT_239919 [Paxillus rubicundulus Ve08.2h10]|uniref:Uncharacterized protein n=1 Tax=Paxillus rubicundulus Ve08.2h10 TaxID=930991 RepID=A0A0D0E6S5_9AGAM|nr:hypothetical protein PAXRUDRAFT_239919 [Paxillus rubicundulus Ve08.2h10]
MLTVYGVEGKDELLIESDSDRLHQCRLAAISHKQGVLGHLVRFGGLVSENDQTWGSFLGGFPAL